MDELEGYRAHLAEVQRQTREARKDPSRWPFREAAAVLSRFNPDMLRPAGASDPAEVGWADFLIDCEPASKETSAVSWQLRDDVRRETFRRMGTRKRMQEALAANPERSDDDLQRGLTAVISGEQRLPLAEMSRGEVAALVTIREWLGGILDGLPNESDLRRALVIAEILTPMQRLAGGNRFVGRQNELATMREYVGVIGLPNTTKRFLAFVKESYYDLTSRPPLLITGPGGVGKSSLVARFILDHSQNFESPDALPFVYLDLDRAALDPAQPLSLVAEAAQQLIIEWPFLETELLSVVEKIRPLLRADQSVFEGARGVTGRSTVVHDFGEVLAKGSAARPVLFAIDTFEEAQYRGFEVLEGLGNLLRDLQRAAPMLRIVLVGRADIDSRGPELPAKELRLEDLSNEESRDLLRRNLTADLSFDAQLVDEIIDLVGRNPLSLRLACTVVNERGVSALKSVDSRNWLLLRVKAETVQARLYGRILAHIHDDDVKKLARTGLVVRRLTKEVIKEVLAVPCGISMEDSARTGELMSLLAKEVALVVPGPDGSLQHRPELRRLMLRDLLEEIPAATTREIHDRAVNYYSAQPPNPAFRAEEIYHRLMRGDDPSSLASRWMDGLQTSLEPSLDEIPSAARIWLSRKLGVTPDPALLAKAELEDWEIITAKSVQRLLNGGDVRSAMDLLSKRSDRSDGSPLFQTESEAFRLLRRSDEARAVAERGIAASARVGAPAVQRELLMQMALIEETAGSPAAALPKIRAAMHVPGDRPETIEMLRLIITEIRLLRKLGSGWDEERRAAIDRSLELLTPDVLDDLSHRAGLLREVVAEIGAVKPELLSQGLEVFGLERAESGDTDRIALALSNWDKRLSSVAGGGASEIAKRAGFTGSSVSPDDWRTFVSLQTGRELSSNIMNWRAEMQPDREVDKSVVDFYRSRVEAALFPPPSIMYDAGQRVLAFKMNDGGKGPLAFETVLSSELEEIQKSRSRRTAEVDMLPSSSSDPYERAHDAQLFGLAFSGGGIRSATFNLGVMQALAELDILRWVDYLSTVSGGGYIGGWLAAWIKRVGAQPPATPVGEVEHRLSPQESARFAGEPVNPIQFLRRSSNYLTPRLGFFGADTWTMISIYLRNVILNQAILISTIAVVLLVPRFASWPFYSVDADDVWLRLLSPAALVCAMVFIALNLWRLEANGSAVRLPYYARQGGIQVLIALPVLAATYLFSLALWQYAEPLTATPTLAEFAAGWWPPVAMFAVLLLLAGFCGVFRRSIKTGRTPAAAGLVVLASLVPAACGGLMLWAMAALFVHLKTLYGALWHALAWGPPVMIAIFSLTAVLHLGLMGINFPDSGREWWSRLGAWLCIYLLGWAALVTVVIYGPLILALSARAIAGVGITWIATTVGGLLASHSSGTGGGANGRLARSILARLAPYVFIAGLLIAISTGLQVLLPLRSDTFAWLAERQLFKSTNLPIADIIMKHFQILDTTDWSPVWIALGALAAIAILLSWRVDINEFSMHHFYRNRLVRCYLGASNLRKPQTFTGFDSHDDIRLADLAGPGFTGPYPLFNTTLNLVSGEDLAWQQRKGASFIFTPKFCGYQIAGHPGSRGDARPDLTGSATWPGYRETRRYAYPELGGISLGTAMAISGAAASPNEGYHSSPATAFLMTVFDVRLGWWLGNPAGKKHHRSAPKFALVHLMRELFGLTNQRSNFVYLSDGGHFENLGIYELVRRRCRYIIACDSDQDGDLHFEDLGNAIRKCRTDMGVDIDIDVGCIRRQPGSPFSRWHCAVGTIHYENLGEDATPGTLVYIKSSLSGDEAADVLNYHNQQPDFPNQSTADQWFDESQFESYRKLGYHVGLNTLGVAGQERPMRNGAEAFFVALRQAWYPPSLAVSSSFSKHATALNQLFERLSQDENLRFLDAQIYPEWRSLNANTSSLPPVDLWLPAKPGELRAGFYFCNSLIQLMECVYLDLHLDQEQDHPDNRSWMNLFKHWAWSGMLRATWAVSVSTYGARFQTFCRTNLGLDTGEVQVELKGINAPELNFHERALVDELCRVYPDVKQTGSVLLLQMVVSDLSVIEASRRASALRFTFGFAVLFQNQFVLFRIQDHLRTIGLGRLALHQVIDRYRFDPSLLQQINQSERTEQDTEVTEELRRMGSVASRRNFDQLLRSVEREPKTPPAGAHA